MNGFKAYGLRSMGCFFLIDASVKGTDPPSTVGGLEGSKKEEGNESAGRAPAD